MDVDQDIVIVTTYQTSMATSSGLITLHVPCHLNNLSHMVASESVANNKSILEVHQDIVVTTDPTVTAMSQVSRLSPGHCGNLWSFPCGLTTLHTPYHQNNLAGTAARDLL